MSENTFCPLLWNHLNTHPDGSVSFCCISKYAKSKNRPTDVDSEGNIIKIYNLNNDNIHDILNSNSYKQARLQMLNGEKPEACSRCYDEESAGVGSRRIYKKDKVFPDFSVEDARKITNPDGSLDRIPLEFVELRLGNTCNLQCRTCDSSSSSKWRNDYKRIGNDLPFKLHNNIQADSSVYDWIDNDDFWNDLLQYNSVWRFSINGGEPTLIKKHFKFLEKLLERQKTDLTLRYNINMTNLNDDIIELWRKFKDVNISCSIDDIGSRNTYIRWPTEWETVIKNLDRLISEDLFKIEIIQTVSFMSYCNVVEFHKFFSEKYPSIPITHNFVEKPYYMSPSVLPKEMREYANKNIENYFGDYSYKFLNIYGHDDIPGLWEKTKEVTKRMDSLFGVRIDDYLKEFNGYV